MMKNWESRDGEFTRRGLGWRERACGRLIGPFALSQRYDGGRWYITHRRTGWLVGPPLPTEEIAMRFIRRIERLGLDWNFRSPKKAAIPRRTLRVMRPMIVALRKQWAR